MTTTMTFNFNNKAAYADLRVAANAALKVLEQTHGVTMELGSCSFTDNSATFKLNVRQAGKTATEVEREKQAEVLKQIKAFVEGIDWDATYVFGGKPMTIVGYDSKARTAPYIMAGPDGKFYKGVEETLRTMTIKARAKAALAA